MGLLLIPIFCVAAVLAHGLIDVVLGPKWANSADLFQILCLAGATQSVGYAISWVFISTGRTAQQVVYGLVSRPIVIGSFFVGSIWGVKGLALAYSLVSAAMVLPAFSYAMRDTPLRLFDIAVGVRELLVMLPAVTGAAWFVQKVARDHGMGLDPAFLLAAGASAVVYLALWALLPSCRATVLQLLQIMRSPAQEVTTIDEAEDKPEDKPEDEAEAAADEASISAAATTEAVS